MYRKVKKKDLGKIEDKINTLEDRINPRDRKRKKKILRQTRKPNRLKCAGTNLVENEKIKLEKKIQICRKLEDRK